MKNTAEQQVKNDLILKSIEYLEKLGYEEIKADLEGYDAPKSYYQKNNDLHISPHIVGNRAGVKYYFNISLKTEEEEELKTKWKFFDTLSKMRDQHFNVITTRGHYKFTEDMLSELHLEKEYIKL